MIADVMSVSPPLSSSLVTVGAGVDGCTAGATVGLEVFAGAGVGGGVDRVRVSSGAQVMLIAPS